MVIGGALGATIGIIIPFLLCFIPGFGAIGWLLWFVTVPVGAIAGGSFGFLFALNPHKFIKRRFQPEAPLYGENAQRSGQSTRHRK